MTLNLPIKGNLRLKAMVDRIAENEQLNTYWDCSNVNAIDRMGINDHGPIHIKIVANLALKLLRLIVETGVPPSITADYGLDQDDAEVVIVLAACLHDIGHIVQRPDHEAFSVSLAPELLEKLLDGIYDERVKSIVKSEVLHAIYAHKMEAQPLTLEAGVLKVADALDMEKGRARIPFEKGDVTIHSISAFAIEKVRVKRGATKPIRIEIEMSNSAGIFQLDNLLKKKLQNSGVKQYFEIRARVVGEEKKIMEHYEL
ncbi:MAG: HD domain-containing protein [Candidatus Bipolaricaulia bacterium]